ncbi:hypothetical protein [Larsenimonas rhizosphaerae]|uniref:Uncharacterized protein n=1 Tax=Larsenimonas rhizosphaerae TaxID=2944682 RepID=A0AA41ZHZ0_9GAMM|nr:hypothetical protein [Larsenimonas rhizosphaerae]MCM2131753.1 hypothetical protein [Larsenimonas rhizosphaerae]MCX2524920.1 hypothetical protein [Larsenimonas rhizosphaerae]
MRQYVKEVSSLIGATLRDARRDCTGAVVGVDQCREHPVVDVIWEGDTRPERVVMTRDQLEALIQAVKHRENDQQQAKQGKVERRHRA